MIRRATTDDIPAIMAMAEVVFRQTYRQILSPEQMDFMMDWMYSEESLRQQMAGQKFFICDGRGFVSFHPDGTAADSRPLFHLEKLYVMPSEQGTGLGRALFETVMAEIRKTCPSGAVCELNVNRNNPAVSFYEHLGMKRARSGDFPIGCGFYMNDYIMSLDV